MNADTELEIWRKRWQSGTTVPLELRTKVERQSRFMKIALIADILVTIVIGGGTTAWALRSPRPDIVLLAVATWLFLAAAWTFTLTVNRGNWSPSAQDTAAFVDLSVRRCQGRLAAIWFASGLFLFQIVFVLSWVYRNSPAHRQPLLTWLLFGSTPIDIVWLCTFAFVSFLVWYQRKKRAELVYFLNLRGQMTEPAADAGAPLLGNPRRVHRGKRKREA
jgi:hypothetical protein